MSEYQEFPKFRYTASGEAIYFGDRAAEDAYEGETFDKPDGTNHPADYDASEAFVDSGVKASNPGYEFVEYPKMIGDITVNSREEEDELTGGTEEEPKAKATSGGKKAAAAAKDADDLL